MSAEELQQLIAEASAPDAETLARIEAAMTPELEAGLEQLNTAKSQALLGAQDVGGIIAPDAKAQEIYEILGVDRPIDSYANLVTGDEPSGSSFLDNAAVKNDALAYAQRIEKPLMREDGKVYSFGDDYINQVVYGDIPGIQMSELSGRGEGYVNPVDTSLSPIVGGMALMSLIAGPALVAAYGGGIAGGAAAGATNSAVTQLLTDGSLDLEELIKAGATGALGQAANVGLAGGADNIQFIPDSLADVTGSGSVIGSSAAGMATDGFYGFVNNLTSGINDLGLPIGNVTPQNVGEALAKGAATALNGGDIEDIVKNMVAAGLSEPIALSIAEEIGVDGFGELEVPNLFKEGTSALQEDDILAAIGGATESVLSGGDVGDALIGGVRDYIQEGGSLDPLIPGLPDFDLGALEGVELPEWLRNLDVPEWLKFDIALGKIDLEGLKGSFPEIDWEDLIPDVNLPPLPDVNLPPLPDVNLPDVNLPDVNLPDVNLPDGPDVNLPDGPDFDLPNLLGLLGGGASGGQGMRQVNVTTPEAEGDDSITPYDFESIFRDKAQEADFISPFGQRLNPEEMQTAALQELRKRGKFENDDDIFSLFGG